MRIRMSNLASLGAILLTGMLAASGTVSAQDESSAAEAPTPLCLDPSVVDPELPGPCPLGAGPYAPETILVPMSFAVDESWTNLRSFPDLWVIGTADDYLSFMVGPLELADGRGISSAEDLVSLLSSSEALSASEPEVITLGGRPATAFEVTNVSQGLFELFLASDRFFLEPGDQARIVVPQGQDTVSAFVVEGYGEPGLAGAIELTQPILDSVVWLDDATMAESTGD